MDIKPALLGPVLLGLSASVTAGTNFLPAVPAGSPGLIDSRLLVADLDADGDLDLLARLNPEPPLPDSRVRWRALLNDGRGQFSLGPDTTVTSGISVDSSALIDLDLDGLPDLVLFGQRSEPTGSVPVMRMALGTGSGAFGTTQEIVLPDPVTWTFADDLDGDGDADFVVVTRTDSPARGLRIRQLVNTAGTFSVSAATEVPGLHPAGLVRYDADAAPDLVFVDRDALSSAMVLLNVAGAIGAPAQSAAVLPHGLMAIHEGRRDGAGRPELLSQAEQPLGRSALRWHLRDAAGAVTAGTPTVAQWDTGMVVADLDSHGSHDVLQLVDGGLEVWLHLGDATGGLTTAAAFDDRMSGPSVGDFDGDGLMDMLHHDFEAGELRLLRGTRAPNSPPASIDLTLRARVVDGDRLAQGSLAAADPDPNLVQFRVARAPEKADLFVLGLDGSFTYVARDRAAGTDEILVLVTDNSGGETQVTLRILLGPEEGGGGAPGLLSLAILAALVAPLRRRGAGDDQTVTGITV